MHLTLLFLASTVLFKWVDAKGNLHVTDRLADVPAKHRAEFAKKMEESQKKKPAPPVDEAVPSDAKDSAYDQYMARKLLEKTTKERAQALREGIGKARKTIASLEEERGNLASNPVLNAAQPIRKQRMEEIEQTVAAEITSIEGKLDDLRRMLIDAKSQSIPDDWVTGL